MASETMTLALDHLQEVQEEHTTILQHLEARPLLDLAGIERRLEELADAIEQLKPPRRRPRSWWKPPGVMLVALLLGYGLCWVSLRGVPRWTMPTLTQPAPAAVQPTPRRGK